MKPELNCSSECDSPLCFIQSGISRREGLEVLQRLCSLSAMTVELPRRPLSPVLSAVLWTLLSCGILLAMCFLIFTLRFKNNRIVKMSSPNLNILTLFGSVLTYSSGFLFSIDEQACSQNGVSIAAHQARVWMLCVGSTLVFGPILGKTWRLYRVFTQRVPDKRVIIRDIQLMGMVAVLIVFDLLILTAWNITDPIGCSRSVTAVVKMMRKDISYSLSQMDSCSSNYSNLWFIIIAIQKGCLFLYGTYLAGLTYNVSHPPVNQSPTIITGVTLVTFSSAVALPVSIFLQAWPNLVSSAVAGAVFICTLATNCMLFVPQLLQWRQFEVDQNNQSQMAKYFSSPSKSQPSVYSQDEIYYLLGENTSMKKLLNEKNAVIDSLQEQVNNAKGKLLRLMSTSHSPEDQGMDSSTSNLNSSSTQTTELQSEEPSIMSFPQKEPQSTFLSTRIPSCATTCPVSPFTVTPSSEPSTLPANDHQRKTQRQPSSLGSPVRDEIESKMEDEFLQPRPFPGSLRTAEETVHFVTSLQSPRGDLSFQLEPNTRLAGFISSEQLQEILQELSVDAVTETTLRSPGRESRSSQPKPSLLALRTPCSPPPPAHFHFPSISPYTMRKRRPPFGSSRRSLAPSCFYTGPENSRCRRTRHTHRDPVKHSEAITDDGLPQGHTIKEEDSARQKAEGKPQRFVSVCHRCSVRQSAEQNYTASPDVEERHSSDLQCKHIRDSCGYWDSDSSSSTDYSYYHRPYCDSYLQRCSLMSSDSSSDSSDSDDEDYASLYLSSRPVVFKEDLKPTFV
ncbi:probable G-protein coupled receptor 156 isoform X1 [Gouania willdenowi]|nr:probable G-protein coupled receptor 156 isoform X1 [Gouania willdenowi]